MAIMLHNEGGYTFVWHGGAYIDVHASGDFSEDMISWRPNVPFDVINVWNYPEDHAEIHTLHDFEQTCSKYVESINLDLTEEMNEDIPPNAGSTF